MPRSETLRIKLETDGAGNVKVSLAGVERGLQGVDGAARKSAGGIDLSAVAMRSFAALSAGTVAAGLVRMSRRAIDTAAAFDDLAQSVGASGTELFQVAQLNGRSAESMSAALLELTDKMRAAIADGTSTAAQHFRALGVAVTDANGNLRASDKVLLDIAQRFASAPDGPEKTAFAMELLGKRSANLIPVLNTLETDLKRLGAGMSEDFGGAAAEFNKNLAQMDVHLQNLLARGLSPVVQGLNAFFTMIRGGDSEIMRTARAIAHWEKELEKASARFRALGGVTSPPTTVAGRTEMLEASKVMATAQQQLERLRARYQELGGAVAQTKLTPPDAAAAKKQIEENKRAAEELRREQEELRRVFEDTRTPMEALNIEFARLAELSDKGLDFDTYARAIFKAQEAADDSAESLRQMSREAALARQSIVDSLGDSLYQAMTGTFESTEDAFEDMLKRMAAKALAAGIVGALAGAGTSTGAWGGFVSGVAGAFGGGRAHGGDVSAGRAYLVGERGPEIIAPGQSGTVIPNHRLGGSSVTVNQSFDFRGAQPGESLRLRAEAERIKAETIGEIFAQIERGGAAARAVGRR